MTRRAFIISLVLLALAVALSATSSLGPMIGFLFALVVVMPVGAFGETLNRGSGPVTGKELTRILAGFYTLLVFVAAIQAWRRFRRRGLDGA